LRLPGIDAFFFCRNKEAHDGGLPEGAP
jgi:hypothetical protein